MSANADTKANTLWGDGAPEVLDLRLLEDGGERGGALDSDVVVTETVGEARMVSEQGVKGRSDAKANILADGTLQVGNLSLLEDGGEHRGAFVSDAVHLQAGSEWKEGRSVSARTLGGGVCASAPLTAWGRRTSAP